MTTAVFPASFDPIHKSHLETILQAARMFAHVRVLVVSQANKDYLLSLSDRIRLVEHYVSKIPNVSVDYLPDSEKLLEYARSIGSIVIVRGVKWKDDVSIELVYAQERSEKAPDVQTILIPVADPGPNGSITSYKLKEHIAEGKDVSKWCDPLVEGAVKNAQTVRANASIKSRKLPNQPVGPAKT